MGWVALGCYALYLALAFVLRSVIQRRRTGSTGFKGVSGTPGSLEWWAGILFGVALIIGVLAPVLDVTDVLDPIGALDGPGAHALGLVLFGLGLAATLYAQLAMGESWRVGVDESERTDLVTGGPFAVVRNPIFAAMIPTSLGLTLMVPNVVAFAGFAALVLALEIQVRLVEEPYLRRVHGRAYASYAAQDRALRAAAWAVWAIRSDSALDSPRDEAGESCRAPRAAARGGRPAAPQAERSGRRERSGRPRPFVPAARCRAGHGPAGAGLRPVRARALAGVARPCRELSLRPSFATLWLIASAALLSTFALQEWIEGWITPGHPATLSHAIAHIGWLGPVFAVALGALIALLVRGSRAAIQLLARRHPPAGPSARSAGGGQQLHPASRRASQCWPATAPAALHRSSPSTRAATGPGLFPVAVSCTFEGGCPWAAQADSARSRAA